MRRNKDPIDGWTLAHVALGFALRRMGFSRGQVLLMAILFEFLEGPLTSPRETAANQFTDIFANVIGWELA